MRGFTCTPKFLRTRCAAVAIAAIVAALALGGCGRESAPAAGGAMSSGAPGGTPEGRAEAASSSAPANPSSIPDIEYVAYGFRLEGALFGPAALERRFVGDRPDWGGALLHDEALQRFLAASRPVVLCQSAEEAVVGYHGPLFGALLLTRWKLGRPIRLMAVEVIPAVDLSGGRTHGAANSWLETLATASGANPAQLAFTEVAAQRAKAVGRMATCESAGTNWGQSPIGGQSPKEGQSPLLITRHEGGQSPLELFDSARGVAALHRGTLALFHAGDAGPLTHLFGTESLAPLASVSAAKPRLHLMPVYRWSSTVGSAERHLLVYADLLQPGRYVLVTSVMPVAPISPATAPGSGLSVPEVHAEFRATLVRL